MPSSFVTFLGSAYAQQPAAGRRCRRRPAEGREAALSAPSHLHSIPHALRFLQGGAANLAAGADAADPLEMTIDDSCGFPLLVLQDLVDLLYLL